MFSANEEEVARFLCNYGKEQLEKFVGKEVASAMRRHVVMKCSGWV